MSLLTITVLDGSGGPVVGANVVAWLSDVNGNHLREFTAGGILVAAVSAEADATGSVVLDLVPNDLILRDNTYYSVKVSNRSPVLILKTSDTQTLLQALAASPQALGAGAMLGDLGDIDLAGLTPGQGLRYMGTGIDWIPANWPSGSGGGDKPWVSLSANTVLTVSDAVNRHKVDATVAPYTITLPTAIGNMGLEFTIKRINGGANLVTVGTTASQGIDGVLTYTLDMQWESVTMSSDNANWMVI